MRERHLVRWDMIQAIGIEEVARYANVKSRAVYTWGKKPKVQGGRRPPSHVDDWLLTHPKTTVKLRFEFLITVNGPAGFMPVARRKFERFQSVMNRGFQAIAGGVGI